MPDRQYVYKIVTHSKAKWKGIPDDREGRRSKMRTGASRAQNSHPVKKKGRVERQVLMAKEGRGPTAQDRAEGGARRRAG